MSDILQTDRLTSQMYCSLFVLTVTLSAAGVIAQDTGLDYVDDFSCPDDLEGYYPHLYR